MMSATLIDQSCVHPITVIMFFDGNSARGFPMLARMGDVLRIHRAELEMVSENFGVDFALHWRLAVQCMVSHDFLLCLFFTMIIA